MGIVDAITDALPVDRNTGPRTYHCDECDREFEVNAPPSRVVCSECRNEDVTLVG